MQDEDEDKIVSGWYSSRPLLALGLVGLILAVGIISFVHAGGKNAIGKSWLGWFLPSFSLELKPEANYLPADGSSTVAIDIIAKDKHQQLLNGAEIEVTIEQGQGDLTNALPAPSEVSKRVLLRAPAQPQSIIIQAAFRGIRQKTTIEAFDPQPPATPALKAPTDGAIVTTAMPTLSGQAPAETKVEVYVDDQQNTILPVDDAGNFAGPLEQALRRGKHAIKILAVNKYGIKSKATDPITIDIRTPDPEVDMANLRIRPNPATAGEVFYIFVPVSSDTRSVKLMMENNPYELADRNKSSIFSAALRAPTAPGLYPLSLIVTNQGGDSAYLENAISLRVR